VSSLPSLSKSLGVAALLAGVLGAAPASAAPVQLYSATTTGLTDMTHQNAYTWQLNNVNLGGATITSAVLSFFGFYNWTSAANDPYNALWVDLLDTSTHTANGQISSAVDDTNTGTLGINDVLDGFRYGPSGTNVSVVSSLAGSAAHVYMGSSTNGNDAGVTGYNPAGGALGSNSGAFGTTPTNWTLTVTNPTVLAALANYIANGNNIALGLDSDCHFGDTSIQFQIFGNQTGTQATVPEPATLLLVGSGIAAAFRRRRKQIAA